MNDDYCMLCTGTLDWTESCHERRRYISTCLTSVDKVVDDLMRHLHLTNYNMECFINTGQVQVLLTSIGTPRTIH